VATFNANAKDSWVYFVTGANKGLYRKVASVGSATALTVAAFPNAVAVGDRYAISPCPFELVMPPLKSTTAEIPDFERKGLKNMQVYATRHTGISGNPNAVWRIGAYREMGMTLAGSNEVAMADGAVGGHPVTTAPGSVDGFVLEPFLGYYGSGVGFELTAVELQRIIGRGRTT
jgi:hypothetical protein